MMSVMDVVPGRPIYQRLPGLTFLPRQPSPRQPLPRLDVAAFVGFAQRGPLNVPVSLEDFNTYTGVFGGDLDLAQEAGEDVVKANLPRTVQQFFANGGRRCYVVRVAGRQAEAARLRLPGVVALHGRSGPRLAALTAASPGRWGADLRLAARQNVIPLPLSGMESRVTTADAHMVLHLAAAALRRSGTPAFYTGDLLRLRGDDGARWLAMITAVERLAANTSTGETVVLHLGPTYRLLPNLETSPPEAVTRVELLSVEGASDLDSTGLLTTVRGQTALALHAADLPRLSASDVLRLSLAGRPPSDPGYLVRIAEIVAIPGAAITSPPQPIFAALFSEALQLEPDELPASPPPALTALELLRLDLLLRLGDERLPTMSALAFNPGHPRFWGDVVLLASSPLSGKLAPAGSSAANGATSQTGGAHANAYAEAAAWYRRLVYDPYDLQPQSVLDAGRDEERTAPKSFNTVAALAGLLAPAGSHLGISWAAALAAAPAVYADAEEELVLAYLPLDLPEIVDEGDPAQLRPPESGRSGNDDLATFDVSVFYDRYLAPPGAATGFGPGESHRTLMQTAFDLHYLQGRELRGLHSLLFLDEVAVVAAPDACHDPWQPAAPQVAPVPPAPIPAAQEPSCPPVSDFTACNRSPVIYAVDPYYGRFDGETSVIVHGEGFSSTATMQLFFGRRPAERLEVLSSQELAATAPPGVRPGPVDVTVQNEHGSSLLAGGFIYVNASTARALPVVIPPGPNELVANQPFLNIHQALAIFSQARADTISLLSLPRTYSLSRSLEWQQALRRRLGLPDLAGGFSFDEPEEVADLSFVAVYHPWLLVADAAAAARVRSVPPDGAIAGLIAARERQRQAWIAPANLPLQEVLGLATAISDDDWAEFFAQRFNLVRPEAAGFAPMSAHTLSGEATLLQISVRRLLILLRKAALQLGMDFVFQPNHELFRQGMRVVLEDFLRFLFQRGAFAGGSEAESFRVIADETVNPPQSVEQGRLVVVIQVAPSQPMEFITVQLLRSGEGDLLATEV